MAILIDPHPVTIETILGDAEAEFVINNAIMMQIFVKPATSSTSYDFTLKDVFENVVLSETNCQGEYNQLTSIPVYGNCYLEIKNSSVDEVYQCVLTFRRS